ncbi:hypothetical protein B0H17DRAFT_1209138 [Mycena rosella]|uniref:DUF6818 domain-containing protein n=1 Tax=Mycena rosella TaxID=1033263 RepID=A0AAD7G624_MYCRO|nr:hypothetical protein B0H17DRAFT_1209138 [Mycena rosella]
MSHPSRPPLTPLPPPHMPPDLQLHTASDGSQWFNNEGQWVRFDPQHPMDVDSPGPTGNSYQGPPFTQPPVQDPLNRVPAQYNFTMRPVPSSSRVPEVPIDPRLLPLPDHDDLDLTDPAMIARARGLQSFKKGAGARRKAKDDPKGKKRAREDSSGDDSDGDAHVTKRGRPHGASNYSKEDVRFLFKCIEKELPMAGTGWTLVHKRYNDYRRQHSRPKRTVKSLENKYKGYLKLKKPTGDADCPPEVKRAYELEALDVF